MSNKRDKDKRIINVGGKIAIKKAKGKFKDAKGKLYDDKGNPIKNN